MQRGSIHFSNRKRITTAQRRGAGKVKFLFSLFMLCILAGMVTYVYFAWQKKDLSTIAGREEIISGKAVSEDVDLLKKLQNAYDGNYVATLTEKEINHYIAKKMQLAQGGALKGFSTVKGVYVDLTQDHVEVFIEREIAQYGQDGVAKTDYIKPFDHTVSMKLKVYTEENQENSGTTNIVEFPGGFIGKSPAPGMAVKVMKPSFDLIADFFKEELKLAHGNIIHIKVDEGKVTLDPRKRVKKK